MVDLLVYARSNGETEKRVHNAIIAEQIRADIEIIDTFGVLRERLIRPSDKKKMILIFVDSERELLQILSLQDLLSPVPSILILNDHNPNTVALAHRLRPRFVGYTDWDTKVLSSIVTGMIRHWGKKEI